MTTLIDAAARLQALDTTQSFIVQAPAGSGKTELLTQRYLALLAQVDQPEEIIAITFTRKAADEMRLRILQALQEAEEQAMPLDLHKQRRWQLAQAALQRNHQQRWHLLENSNRLRVQTIDSLCANITRQMPILARFGAQPAIADDTEKLYRDAAEAVLAELENSQPWTPALCTLLAHLDNQHERVAELFCDMLRQRDQWLPHIFNDQHRERELLENNLNYVITQALYDLQNSLPATLWQEIAELLAFAHNKKSSYSSLPLVEEGGRRPVEGDWMGKKPVIEDYLASADFLLTNQNTWRKTVDKRNGFPAEAKIMKQRMQALLQEITAYETARECFINLKQLPTDHYTDKQWQILEALFTLLPILAAQLHLTFQTYHVVDHTQIAQSALQALGNTDHPTDLALSLDNRIQHLLVDEFQDTSITQLRLLEQLTSGWQPHDGRTLFLVGDPMQSIYRFRKAEVGIFLQVRDQGIGDIQLQFLNLQTNFRAIAPIVAWTNHIFKQIFPQQENISRGAITFSPSTAQQHDSTDEQSAVQTHWLNNANAHDEAQQIIKIVTSSLQQNPTQQIVILVRSRTHASPILQALRQAQIAYRAVEIEKLHNSSVIQDLLALTRALLHLGDRIAWLAILRAPWSGLSLQDLHALTQLDNTSTLWSNLQQCHMANLSSDAQQILQRITPILQQTLQQRARSSLKQWVYGTWLALGGPACLTTAAELNDSKTFFNLLDSSTDITQLETQLQNLYAETPDSTDIRVEVMTMHKAKGLEFDVVILPGLGRSTRAEDTKLLLLMEQPNVDGTTRLLFAPIKASDEKEDAIYHYLAYEEKKKSEFEMLRLLYVAATRAKKSLHLIGSIKNNKANEPAKPPANSLLACLWPGLINPAVIDMVYKNNEIVSEASASLTLQRLTTDWQNTVCNALPRVASPYTSTNPVTANWDIDFMRPIGIVVHWLLCQISHNNQLEIATTVIRNLLLEQGVIPTQLEEALQIVAIAITQTRHSKRGAWILRQQHHAAESEYPLSISVNNAAQQMIIDRTFIDENNIRWIIDYKTTTQAIDIERYKEQLERYAQSMQRIEDRNICLGLYFPLTDEWHEWEFAVPN